jgi:hypothetical protein
MSTEDANTDYASPCLGGDHVQLPLQPVRSAVDPETWPTVNGLVVCDKAVALAEVACLDVAAEVCCVEPGATHGSWASLPLPDMLDEEGFCLRPLPGFSWPSDGRVVPVPAKATHAMLGQIPAPISNEIFIEVRYGLRPSALPNFHFDDVRDGMFRIFVVPDDETGEHRIMVVAEEEAVSKALSERQSPEQSRLIRFLHAAAAPPDRWATTIGMKLPDGSEHNSKQSDSGFLFPHQLASVAWMSEAEDVEVIHAKPLIFANETFGSHYDVKLPAGGVLAHPPGAGKTRIVAAFVHSKPRVTTVLCPPHLVEFWQSELSLFDTVATVVPFGTELDAPGRLVIDEPQDFTHEERVLARRAATKAASVWLVCGTPRANIQLLGDLLLGRAQCHWATTLSEYRGEASWPYIFQKRFLADPPSVCLPRPALETVEVSVNVGVEGIDAAVAGLSGYLMDQMLYLTFGRAATPAILERARYLEEMGMDFGVNPCHEITLADWDAAVAKRSEQRVAAVAARLANLEEEFLEQQQAFANRDDFAALHDLPVVLHVDGVIVESAPAEWNAAWAGQTLEARVGAGAMVSRDVNCAECCKRQSGVLLAIFIGDEASPIGYAPHEGAPPIPAVRIAAAHAGLLKAGAHIKLEVRHVSIMDEEAGNVSEVIASDAVETVVMREVQQLRMEKATLERAKKFAEQVRTSLGSCSSTTCPICLEESPVVAILPDCAHAFCRACFEKTVGIAGDPNGNFGCPVCRCPSVRRDVVIFRHDGEADTLPQKLVRLVELLEELKDEKVLVFVQWVVMLGYLKKMLEEHSVSALALDGDLPTTMDALRRFARPDGGDSSANVLLLSFQRHASGINLQCCRHVVILHPYCSETASDLAFVSMRNVRAYETQAIGRVRRYPQTGTVRVYRFFAACSVEEEIYSTAWHT